MDKLSKLALGVIVTIFLFVATSFATDIPSEVTLFKNVKVFNGKDNKLYDLDVLVVGNKIHKVEKNIPDSGTYDVKLQTGGTKDVTFYGGWEGNYTLNIIDEKGGKQTRKIKINVIDGAGKTLMPGLISSHVHLTHTLVDGGIPGWNAMTWEDLGSVAASSAKEYLMMGFTTVRDMGGMADGFKRAIDKGLLEGPRIYVAGAYIAQTSGHADLRMRGTPHAAYAGKEMSNLERYGIIRLADGEPEMLRAVRENFSNGAAYIKIHAGGGISSEKDPLYTIQYTPKELEAANAAVQNWNTYWTVHAYTTATVNQALDAGAKANDHAQMVDEKTMKRMAKEGIFVTSNLTGMSKGILKHPLYGNPKSPQYIKVVEFMENSKNFAKWVKEYKIKWSFGDDLVLSNQTYFRQHLDHEKWFSGELFGNFGALKGMTSTPGELAQLTGKRNPYPGKLAVIEKGAYADILIVEGNPLEDLSAIGADKRWFEAPAREQNVESIKIIMKDGKIYKNTLN